MQPQISRTTEAPATLSTLRSTTIRVDALPDGRFRIRGATGTAIASTGVGIARALAGALSDPEAHTVPPPGPEPGIPARPRRPRRTGSGWAPGQQRPDVHPLERWTALPDGSVRSPAGRTYGQNTRQARAIRARLGLPDEAA